MRIILLILGLVLSAISLPQIWNFWTESIASSKAYATYSFPKVFRVDEPIEWKGNRMVISDDATQADTQLRGRAHKSIQVKINEIDYSIDAPISISVNAFGMSRYHGSAKVAIMRDQRSGKDQLVFLQSLGKSQNIKESKYRIIHINELGEINEEIFLSSDRHEPIYRLMLMRMATMTSEGFKNNSHSYYPPMILPFIFAPIGLILLVISGILTLIKPRLNQSGYGQ